MEIYLVRIVEAFIIPPGIFIMTIALGYLLIKLHKYRLSNFIFVTSFILFIIFCLPITGKLVFTWLESIPALTEQQIKNSPAQAIVVLGAGRYKAAPEYNQDVVSHNSLVRIRYAAYLHRKSRLPILVSGGNPLSNGDSEALLMQRELAESFSINNVWLEGNSNNTWENAQFSAAILQQKNIKHIFVVTQAWHMPRVMQAFRNTGIKVTPAPTGFRGYYTGNRSLSVVSFLPDSRAMRNMQQALHELIGTVWYKLRY